MINFLGGEYTADESLKEAGLNHWSAPNTGATNASGFTALPGGVQGPYENASAGISNYGHFWTSSSYYDDRYGWSVHMSFDNGKFSLGGPIKCMVNLYVV